MRPAVVGIESASQRTQAVWRVGADLICLMSGGAVAVTLVQRLEAKALPAAQAGAGEDPVVRLKHLIGCDCHGSRISEDDPKQVRLRLNMGMEAALKAGGPGVQTAHGPAAVEVLHGTVET